MPDLFLKYFTEAEDDAMPDAVQEPSSGEDSMAPPEESDYDPTMNADNGPPPDMPSFDDSGSFEDYGSDDGYAGGYEDEESNSGGGQQDPDVPVTISDKVSALLNAKLYQQYLSLLTKITEQKASIKNNKDILYVISNSSIDTLTVLEKLEDNLRLYIKNSFLDEEYSKNLLFFNKCLNLYALINQQFSDTINKGIKDLKQ